MHHILFSQITPAWIGTKIPNPACTVLPRVPIYNTVDLCSKDQNSTAQLYTATVQKWTMFYTYQWRDNHSSLCRQHQETTLTAAGGNREQTDLKHEEQQESHLQLFLSHVRLLLIIHIQNRPAMVSVLTSVALDLRNSPMQSIKPHFFNSTSTLWLIRASVMSVICNLGFCHSSFSSG